MQTDNKNVQIMKQLWIKDKVIQFRKRMLLRKCLISSLSVVNPHKMLPMLHLFVVSALLSLVASDDCDLFQEAACPLYQQNIVGYIVTSDTGQCQER